MKSIPEILAEELGQKLEYVQNVVNLMDEGNTIPFIARYRKEMHGAMDDTTLRNLETRLTYLRNLQERRDEVKKSIENQGKLTQELSDAIDSAATLAEVEDLYRPYKQKRRTRGSIAREKGLAPLAEAIFAQDGQDPAVLAEGYIDPEKGVNSVEEALQGANDIIAEDLSDDADIRKSLRELVMRPGYISVAMRGAERETELVKCGLRRRRGCGGRRRLQALLRFLPAHLPGAGSPDPRHEPGRKRGRSQAQRHSRGQ